MALSYPLDLPTTRGMAEIEFRGQSVVAESVSPLTGTQQTYVHNGMWWEVDVALPPMKRSDAEDWVAFLLGLNGKEGTFYLGDPAGTSPRGTWAGSPLVNGAHAVAVRTIALDGFSAAATGKNGDWVQFGTGSTRTLHKVVKDFAANGSGVVAAMEIWPCLKIALADNAALVTSSAKGVWRLASNERTWSIKRAMMFGINFSAKEAF